MWETRTYERVLQVIYKKAKGYAPCFAPTIRTNAYVMTRHSAKTSTQAHAGVKVVVLALSPRGEWGGALQLMAPVLVQQATSKPSQMNYSKTVLSRCSSDDDLP